MKILLFLIFSTYFLNGVNTYVVQKVDGVEGEVMLIEFDSNGNAYVFSYDGPNGQLYKLNSTGDILWTFTIIDYTVRGIFITSQNDIYMDLYSLSPGYTCIGVLREGAATIQEIIKTALPEPIFLDEEDNLYFNGFDGINLLRPNSSLPIVIKNLENAYSYYGDEGAVVDSEGNIYFGVINGSSPNISVVVLTKEAKHQEIPTATLFDLSDAIYLEHLVADERNDLWVFTYGRNNDSNIQKISNGSIENILTDDTFLVRFALAAKDRIYFAPQYEHYINTSGFYITLDGHVEKIQGLDDISRGYFTYSKAVADDEGNVYIGIYFPYPDGQVLAVRPKEQNNTWINFPRAIRVRFLNLDVNGDLWIVGDGEGVYVLKKGENIPNEIAIPPGVSPGFKVVNLNKKSNEVYLANFYGLYVVKNDSN